MKKKMLSLLLAAAMVMGLAAPAFAAEETEAAVAPYAIPADVDGKLVVIHTNDTHGHDVAVEGETIGTAGVAALKKDFEAAGASVLLLSAGDFSQGTTLVSLDKGASAVAFMNAAGYDAAAPGNHEFDYKMEALEANAAAAEFPILAANIVYTESGEAVFGDHVTFETDIGKVGVFGLDTPETMTKAHPDNVQGLTFYQGEELVACAQEQVDALEAEGCDYIIALAHLGVDAESEPNRSTDVFAQVTGVDLVVDGHSHTVMDGGETVGDALVVSTGEYLNNVGVVITDGETTTAELVSAAEYTKVDADVAAVVNARNDEVTAAMNETFGTTEVLLDGERDPGVRTQETNLGDFACDALLWQARQSLGEDAVDAALTNGGGIRASIAAGEITMNDMKTVFPFGNTVVTIDVTGAQLLEALEAATCSTPTAIGAFPQVSGIQFTIDTTVPYENGEMYPDSTYYAPAAPGSRVTIETVGGETFDLEATYTIATNDFTAAGGDTYYVFKEAANVTMTAVAMEDALINYTNSLGGAITAEQYGESAGWITILTGESVEEPEESADWADVDQDAWYAEAVNYVIENGVMGSTSADAQVFAPNGTVTRATVYQTLYNMEGKPAVTEAATFADVNGTWYADSAAWAEDTGLTTGDGTGSYAGDRAVTRAELATIFARYAEVKGLATATGDLSAYADAADVADWAADGMAVAVGSGILSGKPGDLLDPNGTAVRTELATILLNFSKLAPETGAEAVFTAESVSIEANGRVIPAVVTLPVGEGPFPAVVLNHGHGGSKDENTGFGGIAEALAEAGIASIRMDFPGCGESAEPFTENTLTNMIADSNAAKDYLVANYPVDAEKLGILGYSMGGLIASQIVAQEDDPYQAVVLLSGALVDIETLAPNLFGSLETYASLKATAEADGFATFTTIYGQTQDLSKAWFDDMEAADGLTSIQAFEGPVMILYGDKDEMVTPEMNQAIADVLPEAEVVVVPDADHGYGFYSDQPEVTAMVEGSVAGFFVEHLLGKVSLENYLADTEYDWFLTGKTSYTIQGKMVSADTEIYNELEDVYYTAEPNGQDVVLKGTSGEEWVTSLEKVMETYTKADGSALTAEDFVADTYIDLQTKAEPGTNYACFVPADVQVIVETAWGDVLTANRPEVPHGEGDYLVCTVGEDGQPNLADVWVVNGAVFPNTYDMAEAQADAA